MGEWPLQHYQTFYSTLRGSLRYKLGTVPWGFLSLNRHPIITMKHLQFHPLLCCQSLYQPTPLSHLYLNQPFSPLDLHQPAPIRYLNLNHSLMIIEVQLILVKFYIEPERFCGAPKIAFEATILCNIFSEQEAMKWLRTFQDKSSCTYRVTRGTKTTGSILIYKTVRYCQHFREGGRKEGRKKYISRQGTYRRFLL